MIGHYEIMSPLSAENIMDKDIGVREKVAAWLAQQGVPTVLLFSILYILCAYGGAAVTRIESGYERNAKQLMEVSRQRDETLEKLITQWKDDRRLLIDILRHDQAMAAKEAERLHENN